MTTRPPEYRTRTASGKPLPVRPYGDIYHLRACIVCGHSDDPKVARRAIKAIRKAGYIFPDAYAAIWKVITDHASRYNEAPSIATVRDGCTEDSQRDQIERMVGRHGDAIRLGDLRNRIARDADKAKDTAWKGAVKAQAEISLRGMNVDGRLLRGGEQAAAFAERERQRIFGGADSKPEPGPLPGDESEPDWPVTRLSRTGHQVPEPKRLENTRALLEHHSIRVRYNVMACRREITVPGLRVATDTAANAALAHVHELAQNAGLQPTEASLERHLTLTQDHYHPVAEWIRSVPWDGEDRVGQVLQTLRLNLHEATADDVGHLWTMVRTWLISAVQAATIPLNAVRGIAAQGILVLSGPQGTGKTRWAKALCPLDGAFAEALRLDPDNRDSVAAATGSWLVELGEIDATFRRSDIAALKGFITNPIDRYRSPYEREVEDHPRRTIYIGTVNDREFLRDATGNRRFWTVPVTGADVEALQRIDLQQLWAQVAVIAETTPHWLPAETEKWLRRWNAQFEAIDPVIEALTQVWEPCPFNQGRVSSSEIRTSLDGERIGRREMQQITAHMRVKWGLEIIRVKGQRVWPLRRRTAVDDPAGLVIDAASRFNPAVDTLDD